MAARVGDAVGQFVLTGPERSAGLRVVINLRRLTRGFGVELADAPSKEVLAGIKSPNEARYTGQSPFAGWAPSTRN
jgi:hypothetical protein